MTGMGERGSRLGVGAAALTAILPTLRGRRNSWVGCGRYLALRRHPYPFFFILQWMGNPGGSLGSTYQVFIGTLNTKHRPLLRCSQLAVLFSACRIPLPLSSALLVVGVTMEQKRVAATVLTLLVGAVSSTLGASPSCRYLPGDAEWPSPTAWGKLNRTVGGRLIAGRPLGLSCFEPGLDAAECTATKAEWTFINGL